LYVHNLSTSGFRNLEPATSTWSCGINLILGSNGQGKTNLLEALSVLCNLRSFRVHRWGGVVRHGDLQFRVAGEVHGKTGRRRLEHILRTGPPIERLLLVDGHRSSVPEYLAVCPVFTLTTADRELVSGRPQIRRQFLDRCAFLLDTEVFAILNVYRRLLKQRNAALASGAPDDELLVWEPQLARAAGQLVEHRHSAVERLRPVFLEMYRELGAGGFPEVTLKYRGEAAESPTDSLQKLEDLYRERYNATRARDRQAGYTLAGPHRHDLTLFADGRPVRDVLSSGQTKVVAAALRLATVAVLEHERGEQFPVLVDDVDAELDPAMLNRLGRTLAQAEQVFVSSAGTRDVISQLASARTVWIRDGICTEGTPSGDRRI